MKPDSRGRTVCFRPEVSFEGVENSLICMASSKSKYSCSSYMVMGLPTRKCAGMRAKLRRNGSPARFSSPSRGACQAWPWSARTSSGRFPRRGVATLPHHAGSVSINALAGRQDLPPRGNRRSGDRWPDAPFAQAAAELRGLAWRPAAPILSFSPGWPRCTRRGPGVPVIT